MGYACPVCSAPQADGEHLANHLAFSALLGHDDHADWLDERVPDWGEADPDALFDAVEPHVEETEFPQVFEDTTGERPDVDLADHDHAHRPPTGPGGPPELDETAAEAVEEARRLTRERHGDEEADAEADDGTDGGVPPDGDG